MQIGRQTKEKIALSPRLNPSVYFLFHISLVFVSRFVQPERKKKKKMPPVHRHVPKEKYALIEIAEWIDVVWVVVRIYVLFPNSSTPRKWIIPASWKASLQHLSTQHKLKGGKKRKSAKPKLEKKIACKTLSKQMPERLLFFASSIKKPCSVL